MVLDDKKSLILNPVGGLAGDMLLAALFGFFPESERKSLIEELKRRILVKFEITLFPVMVNGITCLKVGIKDLESKEGHYHHHRYYKDIEPIIDNCFSREFYNELAKKMFRKIAEAEGVVHGISWDKVHFHEVGAVDSIVDILGSLILLEKLGIEDLYHTSPLPVPKDGIISISHGKMPSLAPATAEILIGKNLKDVEEEKELITPTGAIFLAHAEELDSNADFSYSKISYGAGTHVLKTRPNFVRVFLGKVEKKVNLFENEIIEIQINIDDMTPQALSTLYDVLEEGALDIFIAPVTGKKGRPAHYVSILVEEFNLDKVVKFIFNHTTSAGIRYSRKKRFEQNRFFQMVNTVYGPVKVKFLENTVIPEFDQCREIAKSRGIAVYKVIEEVRRNATREG